MQGNNIALGKKLLTRAGCLVTIGQRFRTRGFAPPDSDVHTKRPPVASYQLTDTAIAPNPQGLASQYAANPKVGRHGRCFEAGLLPCAMFEAGNVMG